MLCKSLFGVALFCSLCLGLGCSKIELAPLTPNELGIGERQLCFNITSKVPSLIVALPAFGLVPLGAASLSQTLPYFVEPFRESLWVNHNILLMEGSDCIPIQIEAADLDVIDLLATRRLTCDLSLRTTATCESIVSVSHSSYSRNPLAHNQLQYFFRECNSLLVQKLMDDPCFGRLF